MLSLIAVLAVTVAAAPSSPQSNLCFRFCRVSDQDTDEVVIGYVRRTPWWRNRLAFCERLEGERGIRCTGDLVTRYRKDSRDYYEDRERYRAEAEARRARDKAAWDAEARTHREYCRQHPTDAACIGFKAGYPKPTPTPPATVLVDGGGVFASGTLQSKYSNSAKETFGKACGDGLDEHSACASCGRVLGIAVTWGTTCGHVCLKLPDRLKDSNVTLVAQAAEEDGVSFQPCGGPHAAPCKIGWSRFEGLEWYGDKNEICGRFKNWSHDRKRVFRIVVTEQ